MSLARVISLVLHLCALLLAGVAGVELSRNRVPLIELWGGPSIAGLAVVLVVGVGCLTLLTTRRLRRPDSMFVGAELRVAFILVVGYWMLSLALLQPFRRLVFDLGLGVTAGLFGLVSLAAPGVRRVVGRRTRFAVGFALFNLALIAVASELVLRGFATLRPSPLFAQVDVGVADRLDAVRYPAGKLRFGFPCNDGGHYDEPFVARAPDERLVAMVGDSFSASIVPHPYHFSSVVERELGVPVYNFGIPSVGPLEYLYLLEYEVLPLRPAAVTVQIFVGNDFQDAAHVRRGSHRLRRWFDRDNVLLWTVPRRLRILAKERAGQTSGGVVGEVAGEGDERRIESRDEIDATYPWVLDYSKEPVQYTRDGFLAMETSRIENNCRPNVINDAAMFAALDRIVALMADVPFGVVLIPDVFQLEDPVWEAACEHLMRRNELQRDLPQRALIGWLAEHGVPYLDLLPALRAVPPEADGDRHCYHVNDSHFNARGNEVVGREMAKFVEGLLDQG